MSEWIGCDRCSVAAAMFLVKGVEGELYFCNHHYNEHKEKLEAWSFEVVDLTAKIEEPV